MKDEPSRLEEILARCLTCLDNESIDEDELFTDLEELRDIIEQLDMSAAFARRGGLQVLLGLVRLASLSDQVRGVAAMTIGTMTQNHTEVQHAALTLGLVPLLLETLQSASISPKLASQVLFGLSSVVRGLAEAEEAFLTQGGALLRRGVQAEGTLLARTTFLAYSLLVSASSSERRKDQVAAAVLPDCIHNVASADISVREFTLRLLLALTGGAEMEGVLAFRLEPYAEMLREALRSQYDAVAVADKADQYEAEHDLVAELRRHL